MRGKVEVIAIVEDGREKVLYTEANLVVDHAGETIVDMLTVPSATLSIVPRIMDTSNWVIQAMSFGKSVEGYNTNAHGFPASSTDCPEAGTKVIANRNLTSYSTVSDIGLNIVGAPGLPYRATLSSTPWVSPPPQFSAVPSSVAHVCTMISTNPATSFKIGDEGTNQYILLSYLLQDWHSPGYDVSAPQDLWMCGSMYIKNADDEYPLYDEFAWSYLRDELNVAIPGTVNKKGQAATILPMQSRGLNFSAGDVTGAGWSRQSNNLKFDRNKYPLSSVGTSYQKEISSNKASTNYRAASAGFVEPSWVGKSGVEDVGDGWYRCWNSILTPKGCSGIQWGIYPKVAWPRSCSGAVRFYGVQMEVGSFATDLQHRTDGVWPNNWDFSGSPLAQGRSVSAATPTLAGGGTSPVFNKSITPSTCIVRVSGTNIAPYVSSYLPTNSLPMYPDPLDSRLEKGNTESVLVTSSVLTDFNMGQNLNVIPYRNQVEAGSTHIEVGNLSSLWVVITAGDSTPPTNLLGVNAYQLGCYAEGSSMGGTNFIMVSSLTTSGYLPAEDYYVRGNYDSGFNEASSMDISGFIGKIYDPVNATVGDNGHGVELSGYGLIVSSIYFDTGAFVDNCLVVYETNIYSGDCGMANLYGGIYNMGLWTLDTPATLKTATAPFSFDPVTNPRKYKLFSSKKFIDNLVRINDSGTDGGLVNYSDLKIKWTLDFRSQHD